MKLNQKELANRSKWDDKGYILPNYDRDEMLAKTKANPEWVHFGAGNIFRAFPAVICDNLLNKGLMTTGIVVAEGYDYEIKEKSFSEYDNLVLAVTLKSDGGIEKRVVGSIAEVLCANCDDNKDWDRLEEVFKSPSLKMVSFTITEKGYSLIDSKGEFLKDVAEDFKNGPDDVKSYMGKLVSLCYTRFKDCKKHLTLVSMDNCSHNGTKLMQAVTQIAGKWLENGKVDKEFVDYMKNDISYPWSMIDKITPRPSDDIKKILLNDGLELKDGVVTKRNTYIAPFVNAEESEYLVIEDSFKNGKLPLDEAGVIYADRETVDKVEKMKVCTCLNPLHTALAIFGCLLKYTKINEEMKDDNLVELIKQVGYKEGLPVVIDPKILSPKEFIDQVINVRLPNPFMPDTPQRIACDTSQKVGIRFGETIKAYIESDELKVDDLKYIPLVLAGWCRYLMAVDDEGDEFELSPDPMLNILVPIMRKVKLGDNNNTKVALTQILSSKNIFGVDLYEVGLGERIESMFGKMNEVGGVRKALQKYC